MESVNRDSDSVHLKDRDSYEASQKHLNCGFRVGCEITNMEGTDIGVCVSHGQTTCNILIALKLKLFLR